MMTLFQAKRISCFVLTATLLCSCVRPARVACGDELLLSEGWMISSDGVAAYPATVPSTVAGALFDAGYFPQDLLESDNYSKADKSVFDGPWTYSTTFDLDLDAKNYELRFDGLDYRADIFLNGRQIASSDTTSGMFIVREYDVTGLLKRHNELSVTLAKAQPGDLNHGFVDWNPRPLDESMGIIRPVSIHGVGNVSIKDVYVKPLLDLETWDADLEVMVTLKNCSAGAVDGTIVLSRQDAAEACPVDIRLAAGETREILLTAEQAANLHIDNPRIWWTWDLGTPELYGLHVEFAENGTVSDRRDVTFGVRKIESRLVGDNYRQFTLNGQDILIRGAGWTDDIFLRDTHEKTDLQLCYAMDMNMNCIRFENIWGKDDHVYDLCDRYGLLAMVGWSCQWEWESYCGLPETDRFGCISTPEQMDLAVRYFHDQVIRLHNHVSIFAWLTGSDRIAMPELDLRYREIYDRYEYRPYVCSAKGLLSATSGWSGMKMEGPYEYVGPEYWYLDTGEGGAFGFNTETCVGASFPQKESLMKMIPEESLWPLSNIWDFHCTASSTAMNSTEMMQEVAAAYYGDFTDLDDFLMKAYMVDYNGTRAMFESFRVNVPNTTGIVQWMFNSAWPSLYWQQFDYYGVPTAAYYATRKACEPLQLIFNYKDRKVYAVNETLDPCEVEASLKVFDADSGLICSEGRAANVSVREPFPMFDLRRFEGKPHFVALSLTAGETEVDNFYCIPAKDNVYAWGGSEWYVMPILEYSDLRFAFAGGRRELETSVENTEEGIRVTVTNKSDRISCLNILKLKDETGNLIVPAFWSDNFFPLLPGQSKTVECRFGRECCGTFQIEVASK